MRQRVFLAWLLLGVCASLAGLVYYVTDVIEGMMTADQFATAARWARLVDAWVFPVVVFLWVISAVLTPDRGQRLPLVGDVALFGACVLIFTVPAVMGRVQRSLAAATSQASIFRQADRIVTEALTAREGFDESGAWARCLFALATDGGNVFAKEMLLNAPSLTELRAARFGAGARKDRFERIRLAMWCREQGDGAAAREEFAGILAEDPNDPSAARALRADQEPPHRPTRSVDLREPVAGADNGAVPRGMTYVPEGTYCIRESRDKIGMQGFHIDRFEVTNAEYAKFLEAVEQSGDANWRHPQQPVPKDHTPAFWGDPIFNGPELPVVGVDWFDAYAFSMWANKRLPLELEWEAAARGADGRVYPWGDRWDRSACNSPERFVLYELWGFPTVEWPVWVGSAAARDAFIRLSATAPGASFPIDESPTGCFDMAGNVEEWVADWFENASGGSLAQGGNICGVRGGSWVYGGPSRPVYYRTAGAPNERRNCRGFRCAR